ncbi:MAG: PTS sugar transporter subunit IIA [Planctomycetes bacterium]|nr:PTS sugar transporter subunit IIA [Planctomycetota bacterium]
MQLTLRDAARLLHVDEDQIVRWIKEGGLPASLSNEQYRINRAQLLEWSTTSGVQVSPRIFADAGSGEASPPSLRDALHAGGVRHGIRGSDAAAVLRSIVDVLPLPDDLDREFLHSMLLAREKLGSTGVGDGIAIPHVRNPIVLHVECPLVALSFLEQPVDFGAMDGKPVHCLFTLVSPTMKNHLHLLSRLAFALRDADLRKAIAERAPADRVLGCVGAVDLRIRDSQTTVVRKTGDA